ncbi:MAG: hypothetical protein ABI765_00315 [Gemmatimonadota bacterium]
MALALFSGLAAAQDRVRTTAESPLTKDPGDQPLGTLSRGVDLVLGQRQGEWVAITLDGWIFTSSVAPTDRDGYDMITTRRPTENLRTVAKGPLLARLQNGVLLKKLETKGGWTHVQRSAWIQARVVGGGGDSTAVAAVDTSVLSGHRVEVPRGTRLLQAAEGPLVATLAPGARAKVISRSGDWLHVQIDGWVRDSTIKLNDSNVLTGVSLAELRAEPAKYVGQTVEWRVQFLAVQKADELRPEMPAGATYLLTRGPLPEPGFIYVIVAADKVAQFTALPALQELLLRVVIKAAQTRYLANPVVELVSVEKGLGIGPSH